MALSKIVENSIADEAVSSAKLKDFSAAVDLNGVELVLDADADTSITADTDDRIDFKIANTDHISFGTSSGDTVIKAMVDAKDILFQQFDGRTLLDINDGGFVGIANGATGPGEIRIFEDTDNGSNYVGLNAGSISSSFTLTLPTADGSSGQFLKTDGSGALSFDTVSSAADDLTAGDAAVNLTTTSGNITIDAQGGDTDIIFKGTDGSSDITPMTLDMSDAGALLLTGGKIDLKNAGTRSKILFYCESGNAHAQTLQAAPHSESASNTLTLPSTGGDVDLVSTASTATLTNKTITNSNNTVGLATLDIDGGTDIGANLADADLFIVDDGAGGTNRKMAASRIATYVGASAGAFSIDNLDIDGGTDIGEAIVDADLFIIDNGAGGTNRKTTAARLKTYIGSFDPDGAQTFNDSGAAVDFRIESDNNANMFVVDGSTDCIAINQAAGSGSYELDIAGDVRLYNSGDGFETIDFDSNRGSAGDFLGDITGKWNGTDVARISLRAGSDTSNKDDGAIHFETSASGSLVETLHLTNDGRGLSQYTAKAWCTANGTGTVAIIDSHNISSLADPESGQLVNNFANSMANSNYTVIVNAWHGYAYTFGGMDMSTSSFKAVQSNGSSYVDTNRVHSLVFGD